MLPIVAYVSDKYGNALKWLSCKIHEWKKKLISPKRYQCDWQESKGVIKDNLNLILINSNDDSEEVKSSVIYNDIICTWSVHSHVHLYEHHLENTVPEMYMWVSEF